MAVVLTAALTFPVPFAHTVTELESWQADWNGRAMHSLDVGMMDERRDMRDRHQWFFDPQPEEVHHRNHTSGDVTAPPPTVWPGDWAALVAAYFPSWAVNDAMKVIGCETGYTYDPNSWNTSSGAAGLFQHMPRYWEERSTKAGWAGYSIFDPEANVAVAAWLWGQTGTWQHWTCKP